MSAAVLNQPQTCDTVSQVSARHRQQYFRCTKPGAPIAGALLHTQCDALDAVTFYRGGDVVQSVSVEHGGGAGLLVQLGFEPVPNTQLEH